ncbi:MULTISPECIES: NAD(P)/FAD-dependent oxidoreductase [unclassified Bradyrhizobium]|uniref:dihydrolipoyl dehydrogenase family protein n=1 Tax=unclassified Bradyrhizobium TaxID=2631580 RepID=UPI001FFAFF5A
MARETFDVVILGGGNAGIGVTGAVRRAGQSVAMIEASDLGGTCPNRGCTSKKVLVAAGQVLHDIERAAVHHIAVGKLRLDWAALIDREKDLIKDIPASLARAMARREVEVIKGFGTFVAPDTIRVGDRLPEARHIVIANGSKPRPLPIPGAEHMITTDDMLRDRELPACVIFVGGGVISLEFSHVYARAGADVTILEVLPQLLPAMDTDAVARLQTESERIGIKISTSVSVRRIEPAGEQFRVIFTHDGVEQVAMADRVVNGAGRVANIDNLDLAAGRVTHANGRVAVDQYLRSTSNPRVYVCGDAVPISPQLSPIATYEGDIVGRNIVAGAKYMPDYVGMATSVYTVPALAAVGLTEIAARRTGATIDVHDNDMRDWFSARSYAETVAWSKVIVDRVSDCILGAHFVGHGGQELINIFGLAIKFELRPARSETTSTPIRRFRPTSSTCSDAHSDTLSSQEREGISSRTPFRRC